jgi:H/ACA ribonucleoprotein complex subunit 4
MNGFFIVNKPSGMKSRWIPEKISYLLKTAPVGHVGTLDPNTTGVLAILVGKATKLSLLLSTKDKIYVAKMHMHAKVSKKDLLSMLKKFTGEINQRVPKISAVKRQVRKRKIHYIRIKSIKGQNVEFEIKCQHGTYVRTLCHDVGEALGIGAHMYELVRIKSGDFTLKDAIDYDKIIKKIEKGDLSFIRKPIEAVAHEKKVYVDERAMKTISMGTPLFIPGVGRHSAFKKGDLVALIYKNELIAIGRAEIDSADLKKIKQGIAIKTDLVLI